MVDSAHFGIAWFSGVLVIIIVEWFGGVFMPHFIVDTLLIHKNSQMLSETQGSQRDVVYLG